MSAFMTFRRDDAVFRESVVHSLPIRQGLEYCGSLELGFKM